MDIELQKILSKYQEFVDFTKEIETDFSKFSRKELAEFNDRLYAIKQEERDVRRENRAIIGAKKLEEFPILLDVHHYPVINEFEFLNKDQKICLDKYLSIIGHGKYAIVGSPAYREMSKVLGSENTQKAFDELFKRHIVDRCYEVQFCCEENQSVYSSVMLNNIIMCYDLRKKTDKTPEEVKWLRNMTESLEDHLLCQECGSDEIEHFESAFREAFSRGYYDYKVLTARDTTYDAL